MKEIYCKLNQLKVVLAIIFCISIVGVMFITIGGLNTTVAQAAESSNVYELKIKLENNYYWVKNDHSVSSERSYLTVGDEFNIANFRNYIGNNEGFKEGKYVQGFKYENTENECFFASNMVLQLGTDTCYVIEPDYANETYIFSFDLNWNGGIPISPQEYHKGDGVQSLLDLEPVRTGYTFNGWKLNGVKFTYNSIPDMSPNEAKQTQTFMLVAQWTALTYEITFVLDNNQTIKKDVTYGEAIGNLPSVTDNGYEFLGFAFSADSSIIDITNEEYVWTIANNATVYIRRSSTPTQYSISYNGNGGEIINGTAQYNVEQLPLKLNYTAEREFDYINGFKLNNAFLSGEAHDILPAGTLGNITLKAQWKAHRTTSSKSAFVTSETYDHEYTIVDCKNISKTAVRTITITQNVNEITFIGNISHYVISKNINVLSRTTPLTIRIKDLDWGSQFGSPLIDARNCKDLTLDCVNTNRLHGGMIFEEPSIEFLAVIMCQNLTISGDNLSIIGASAYSGLVGGIGILAVGNDENASGMFGNAVTINITIDYLYVKGGQGGAGSDSHIDGCDGGAGVVSWVFIVIDGHYGQEVHLLGGDGGSAKEGGTNGERGVDAGFGVQGPYYGSDGYVSGN